MKLRKSTNTASSSPTFILFSFYFFVDVSRLPSRGASTQPPPVGAASAQNDNNNNTIRSFWIVFRSLLLRLKVGYVKRNMSRLRGLWCASDWDFAFSLFSFFSIFFPWSENGKRRDVFIQLISWFVFVCVRSSLRNDLWLFLFQFSFAVFAVVVFVFPIAVWEYISRVQFYQENDKSTLQGIIDTFTFSRHNNEDVRAVAARILFARAAKSYRRRCDNSHTY